MKSIRFNLTAVVAALTLSTSVLAPVAFAQDKMAPKMGGKMMGDHKMSGKMGSKMMAPVYVCKECKMAFTADQAKKMGMKDPMGHKMVKMAKMPSGYKMAPTMDKKMGGSKMMDHKMGDHKMGDKPMPKM